MPTRDHSGQIRRQPRAQRATGRAAAPGRRESKAQRVCLEREPQGGAGLRRRGAGGTCSAAARRRCSSQTVARSASIARSALSRRMRTLLCSSLCACRAPRATASGARFLGGLRIAAGRAGPRGRPQSRRGLLPARHLPRGSPGSMPSQPLVADTLTAATGLARECAGPGAPHAGRMPSSVSRHPARPGQARRRAPAARLLQAGGLLAQHLGMRRAQRGQLRRGGLRLAARVGVRLLQRCRLRMASPAATRWEGRLISGLEHGRSWASRPQGAPCAPQSGAAAFV